MRPEAIPPTAVAAYLFHEDNANIVAHVMTAQDRVITPRVVMAIVGATTVQLGALALTMSRYLYPGPPKTLTSRTSSDAP